MGTLDQNDIFGTKGKQENENSSRQDLKESHRLLPSVRFPDPVQNQKARTQPESKYIELWCMFLDRRKLEIGLNVWTQRFIKPDDFFSPGDYVLIVYLCVILCVSRGSYHCYKPLLYQAIILSRFLCTHSVVCKLLFYFGLILYIVFFCSFQKVVERSWWSTF